MHKIIDKPYLEQYDAVEFNLVKCYLLAKHPDILDEISIVVDSFAKGVIRIKILQKEVSDLKFLLEFSGPTGEDSSFQKNHLDSIRESLIDKEKALDTALLYMDDFIKKPF